MESNYSNRDFEHLLKEQADQHRMFPSEKTWKGIHDTLHTRRKWYGFGLALLLLLTGGAVSWVMHTNPVTENQFASDVQDVKPTLSPLLKDPAEQPVSDDITELIPFARNISHQHEQIQQSSPVATPTAFVMQQVVIAEPVEDDVNEPTVNAVLRHRPVSAAQHDLLERNPVVNAWLAPTTPSMDAPIAESNRPSTQQPAMALPEATYPLTIESVTNSYRARPKRLHWQVFVTPTISYRSLSENKDFSAIGGAVNGTPGYPFASNMNVNNAVNHKPDLGLQLGAMASYPLGSRVSLRGGLQFNINRYDIKAFLHNGEVAQIDLSNSAPPVSTYTNYRLQNGEKSDWLKNYYLSVSVPLGAEVILFGNSNTNVGIAGTVQPTYIIKERAYLISTDYKNYAEVPWLVRRMNVSTGFETFVNYRRGNTRFQVGPQVRYQWLSSFKKTYPVKENIFDFGVKIGVSMD